MHTDPSVGLLLVTLLFMVFSLEWPFNRSSLSPKVLSPGSFLIRFLNQHCLPCFHRFPTFCLVLGYVSPSVIKVVSLYLHAQSVLGIVLVFAELWY